MANAWEQDLAPQGHAWERDLMPGPPRQQVPVGPGPIPPASKGPIGFFESLHKLTGTPARGMQLVPGVGSIAGAAEGMLYLDAANRLKRGFDYSKPTRPAELRFGAQGSVPAQYATRKADEKLIGDLILRTDEEQRRGYTTAGAAAKGIAVLPKYAIEFMLTGGLAGMGNKAFQAAGTRVLRKYAKTAAGKAALKAAGWAGGAITRGSLGLGAVTAEKAAQRQVKVQVLGEGEEGWATSLVKAWGDTVIEAASETAGETLTGIPAKILSKTKLGKKLVNGLRKGWMKTTGGTAGMFARNLAKKGGLTNILDEFSEERLGTLLRAITGVDDFGAGPDAGPYQRVLAGIKADASGMGAELLVLAAPMGAQMAAGTGAAIRETGRQSDVAFLRHGLVPPSVDTPVAAERASADLPPMAPTSGESVGTSEQVPTDRTPAQEQVSFRNVDLAMQRKAQGLPPVPVSRSTLKQKMQQAVAEGRGDIETARGIAADILATDRMVTDMETHGLNLANNALNQQIADMDQQLVDFDADSADFKAVSERHDTAIRYSELISRAGERTGTMWGKIGGARQVILGDNGNYVGVLARAKKRGGRNLTEAEQVKLRKQVSDVRAGRKKAEEGIQRDADVRTRKYVARVTKKNAKGKMSQLGKLAEMSVAEKDAQVQDLLSRELTEITLTDIFMNLASRSDNPSIDTTVQRVRQLLPDVTHTQIVDAFDQAGRRRVRNTSAMEDLLKELKRQLKKEKSNLTTIDDVLYWLKEGRLPDETEASLTLDDKVVRDLQKVVDQVKGMQKKSEPYLQRKLEKQISFLEARIAAKDFGNKKQDFAFKPSRYTLELQYRAAKLNADIARSIARTKPKGPIRRVLAQTARSIQAMKSSYDNSGLLNQGGFVALGHPIKALKTLPKAIAAATSTRRAFMIEQEILNRPNAPLYQRHKLGLTRSTNESTFSEREEEFRESVAEWIPGVRASNRMFSTTLNILRADAFDAMAGKDAFALGLSNVENQAVADFVNITTGRGNIRGIESTVNTLNGVLWAPRRFISRFQMFGTLGGQIEWGFKKGQSKWQPEVHLRGTPAIRKAMARETARYLMGLSATFLLAGAAGAEFEWDPRSSDFLKMRWGNLRLDPLSGFAQTLTILSRLGTLQTKGAGGGQVEDLSGYDAHRMVQRFFQYKLSPAIGITWSMMTKQTPFDGPIERDWSGLAWAAKEAAIPISVDDVLKAADDQGIPRAVIFSTFGILGAGVQVYGDTPQSSGPRRIYRRGAL